MGAVIALARSPRPRDLGEYHDLSGPLMQVPVRAHHPPFADAIDGTSLQRHRHDFFGLEREAIERLC